jgi:hypothetical protein
LGATASLAPCTVASLASGKLLGAALSLPLSEDSVVILISAVGLTKD